MIALFVGERRSPKARRMGVRWEHGRLAAKQLFDALEVCGFDKAGAQFANIFERAGRAKVVEAGGWWPIIAMGRKVQRELSRLGVPFTPLVHPAARGRIRSKQLYALEVRRALTNAGVL